jgi:hypothetical protein
MPPLRDLTWGFKQGDVASSLTQTDLWWHAHLKLDHSLEHVRARGVGLIGHAHEQQKAVHHLDHAKAVAI